MEERDRQMEREREVIERRRRRTWRGMRDKAGAQPGGGMGRRRSKPWELEAFSGARPLPRAWLLRFPQCKGNPGKPLWAQFVCSRPGSGDAVDLVFKQWVCSLLGWGRGLLAILKPADWIEFRPL